MSDIHQQLKKTFADHQQLVRVQRHLDELNVELDSAHRALDKKGKDLKDEFKDIEKLEKLSLKGLFHKVLGSKEEQMEKERQEYLQVSLKYDEAKKTVDLLEYERSLLEKKVKDLPHLTNQLEILMKQREKLLVDSGTAAGKKILDILLLMDTNRQLAADLKALIKSGNEITMTLDKMITYLGQAKDWGRWDSAGRRRSASYMKHNSIDRARDMSYHAKHLLVRFEKDLRHIYGHQNFDLHFEFDTFSRFTDIFFDNLISDWIIQQKIQNALASVLSVKDKVIRLLHSLEVEVKNSEEKYGQLEHDRKKLIIES